MPSIYKLINPLDNNVYYIGYTERTINERYEDHINKSIYPTTQTILDAGLFPNIIEIETGSHVTKAIEMRYIKEYISSGCILDNKDGVINYQKKELEGISTKLAYELSLLPKELQYKAALNLILKELPLNATYPICVRIKDIIETILPL